MNAEQNKEEVQEQSHHQALYIRCPYNRRHYVLEPMYPAHLVACGQKNPHINVIICPFDGSHRCRDIQLMSKHLEDCRSQGQFVDRNYHLNSSKK